MRSPPDIDPAPDMFEPTRTNRRSLAIVLSVFAAGLIACVIAFALLR